MATKKTSTKNSTAGEERFTATGKGITVLTPGGSGKSGKGKAKKQGGK